MIMKKLLPFALALVFVGQGCLSPAPTPTSQESQTPSEGTTVEGSGEVNGEVMLEDGVMVFEISGKNSSYTPNKITVKQGQKMRIRFTSEQGFHDWTVDAFDAHTIRVNTGEEALLEFTPDEAGTFEFYSSVGADRANGMVGTLVVEEVDAGSDGTEAELNIEADTELKL